MRKARKHYTAEEKVAILRRHVVDNEPVSKLCDEPALRPTAFYRRQKEFFENGAAAFGGFIQHRIPDFHFSFGSANHRVASDAFIYVG